MLLGGLLFLLQRKLIYQPTPALEHNFATLKVNGQNTEVEALVAHKHNSNAIIYFGGNAEQIAYTANDFFQEFPQHTSYLMK